MAKEAISGKKVKRNARNADERRDRARIAKEAIHDNKPSDDGCIEVQLTPQDWSKDKITNTLGQLLCDGEGFDLPPHQILKVFAQLIDGFVPPTTAYVEHNMPRLSAMDYPITSFLGILYNAVSGDELYRELSEQLPPSEGSNARWYLRKGRYVYISMPNGGCGMYALLCARSIVSPRAPKILYSEIPWAVNATFLQYVAEKVGIYVGCKAWGSTTSDPVSVVVHEGHCYLRVLRTANFTQFWSKERRDLLVVPNVEDSDEDFVDNEIKRTTQINRILSMTKNTTNDYVKVDVNQLMNEELKTVEIKVGKPKPAKTIERNAASKPTQRSMAFKKNKRVFITEDEKAPVPSKINRIERVSYDDKQTYAQLKTRLRAALNGVQIDSTCTCTLGDREYLAYSFRAITLRKVSVELARASVEAFLTELRFTRACGHCKHDICAKYSRHAVAKIREIAIHKIKADKIAGRNVNYENARNEDCKYVHDENRWKFEAGQVVRFPIKGALTSDGVSRLKQVYPMRVRAQLDTIMADYGNAKQTEHPTYRAVADAMQYRCMLTSIRQAKRGSVVVDVGAKYGRNANVFLMMCEKVGRDDLKYQPIRPDLFAIDISYNENESATYTIKCQASPALLPVLKVALQEYTGPNDITWMFDTIYYHIDVFSTERQYESWITYNEYYVTEGTMDLFECEGNVKVTDEGLSVYMKGNGEAYSHPNWNYSSLDNWAMAKVSMTMKDTVACACVPGSQTVTFSPRIEVKATTRHDLAVKFIQTKLNVEKCTIQHCYVSIPRGSSATVDEIRATYEESEQIMVRAKQSEEQSIKLHDVLVNINNRKPRGHGLFDRTRNKMVGILSSNYLQYSKMIKFGVAIVAFVIAVKALRWYEAWVIRNACKAVFALDKVVALACNVVIGVVKSGANVITRLSSAACSRIRDIMNATPAAEVVPAVLEPTFVVGNVQPLLEAVSDSTLRSMIEEHLSNRKSVIASLTQMACGAIGITSSQALVETGFRSVFRALGASDVYKTIQVDENTRRNVLKCIHSNKCAVSGSLLDDCCRVAVCMGRKLKPDANFFERFIRVMQNLPRPLDILEERRLARQEQRRLLVAEPDVYDPVEGGHEPLSDEDDAPIAGTFKIKLGSGSVTLLNNSNVISIKNRDGNEISKSQLLSDYDREGQRCDVVEHYEVAMSGPQLKSIDGYKEVHMYTFDHKHPINMIAAIFNRHVGTTLEPCPKLVKEFQEYVASELAKSYDNSVIRQSSVVEWISARKQWTKSKKTRYQKEIIAGMLTPDDFKIPTFKAMVKSGEDYYTVRNLREKLEYSARPRLIWIPPREMSLLTWAQECLLKKAKSVVPGFCHGKNNRAYDRDINKWFESRNPDEYIRIAIDGSSHDAHQHHTLIKAVDGSFGNAYKSWWKDMLQVEESTFDKIYRLYECPDAWLALCGSDRKVVNKIKIRGTTFSGHPTRTTLGNTMRVSFYTRFILSRAEINDYKLWVAGDDVCLWIKRNDLRKFEDVFWRCYSKKKEGIHGLGQCAKKLDVGEWWDLDFVSKRSILVDERIVMIRDLRKLITKSRYYTGRKSMFLTNPRLHSTAVGLSDLAWSKNHVWLSNVAKHRLRIGFDDTKGVELEYKYAQVAMEAVSSRSHDEFASLCKMYDVSETELLGVFGQMSTSTLTILAPPQLLEVEGCAGTQRWRLHPKIKKMPNGKRSKKQNRKQNKERAPVRVSRRRAVRVANASALNQEEALYLKALHDPFKYRAVRMPSHYRSPLSVMTAHGSINFVANAAGLARLAFTPMGGSNVIYVYNDATHTETVWGAPTQYLFARPTTTYAKVVNAALLVRSTASFSNEAGLIQSYANYESGSTTYDFLRDSPNQKIYSKGQVAGVNWVPCDKSEIELGNFGDTARSASRKTIGFLITGATSGQQYTCQYSVTYEFVPSTADSDFYPVRIGPYGDHQKALATISHNNHAEPSSWKANLKEVLQLGSYAVNGYMAGGPAGAAAGLAVGLFGESNTGFVRNQSKIRGGNLALMNGL